MNEEARALVRAQLINDEARRTFPYLDTVGKITIGIGRNLTNVGLSADEIEYLFANDLRHAEQIARLAVGYGFDLLTPGRQAVIVNMAFNLGSKLLQFRDTLAAVKDGRYDDAADHMLDSLWAKQVGDRAARLAALMRGG